MRVENKYNRKFVICDNLNDFFAEFRKFRNSKTKIAKKENFSDFVFLSSSGTSRWFFLDLDFRKKETWWSLELDISSLDVKSVGIGSEWDLKLEKIIKVLEEIWERGSADTSSLDLNWPVVSKDDKSEPTQPPKKENYLGLRIGGGILFILIILLLIYLFRKRKSSR